MRSIEQHQIQPIRERMQRQRTPGLAFHENHPLAPQIHVRTKLADRSVRTLKRESRMMPTDLRKNNRAAPAPGLRGKLKRSASLGPRQRRQSHRIPRMKFDSARTYARFGHQSQYPTSLISEQDAVASQILASLADEAAWKKRFAEKREIIRRLASEALDEEAGGETLPLHDLL